MRHASLFTLSALGLGVLTVTAGCDRSANAPASPRTSEMVQLSQAPVDAVPLSADAPSPPPKPVEPPVQETPAPEAPSAETQAATVVSVLSAKPAPEPAAPEAPKPAATPDVVPQN